MTPIREKGKGGLPWSSVKERLTGVFQNSGGDSSTPEGRDGDKQGR